MTEQKHDDARGASLSDAELGADSDKRLKYCSFCGARQDEVRVMISSYEAIICDHCVQLCNEILIEKEIPLIAQAAEAPNISN